jgi:hypothetical protein
MGLQRFACLLPACRVHCGQLDLVDALYGAIRMAMEDKKLTPSHDGQKRAAQWVARRSGSTCNRPRRSHGPHGEERHGQTVGADDGQGTPHLSRCKTPRGDLAGRSDGAKSSQYNFRCAQ